MNRSQITKVAFFSALFFLTAYFVQACEPQSHTITTKDGSVTEVRDLWFKKETRAKLMEQGLSEVDIALIKKWDTNGYSVIEQDEDTYKNFLKDVKKQNKRRPKECPVYDTVTRDGRWTAVASKHAYDETTKRCIPRC